MRFMQTESVLQTKNRSGPAKNRFSVALIKVFRPLKEEEELVSLLQKLNNLRNLMVSLQTCSTKMIKVRSYFSVGRPLSWMTLLFQMRV